MISFRFSKLAFSLPEFGTLREHKAKRNLTEGTKMVAILMAITVAVAFIAGNHAE